MYIPEYVIPKISIRGKKDTKEKRIDEGPFVAGRSSEIISLKKAVDDWKNGQRALIILTGSSGNGKSSLSKIIASEVKEDTNTILW